MELETERTANVRMILVVIALIAIVGLFAYYMANIANGPNLTSVESPARQIATPVPAKPRAQ